MTRPGPGKFEGNESLELSEILYAWTQNGLLDDQVGGVDELGWHGYVYIADGDEAFDQVREAAPEVVTSPELGFVLHEDGNGFFTYEVFESSGSARTVFDEWRDEIESTPTCDICGHTMEAEPEVEWNGETGNHRTCEEVKA